MYRPLVPAVMAILAIPPTVWIGLQAHANLLRDSGSKSYGRLMAILLFAALGFVYSLLSRFALEQRARAKGCMPAPSYPHRDPVLGLDIFIDSIRAMRSHSLSEAFKRRFARMGHTYWNVLLGKWLLMTDEPENVKAILATNFDDYHIGGPRLDAVTPILGFHSIFTTNGPLWQESRALLRPSFVRDQVADFECFNRHIGHLLERIPRDGSTFDMQELLMRMTMDSSTDFLLGSSTDTLANPSPRAQEFVDAFEVANALGAQRSLLGQATHIIRSPALSAAAKTARSFVDFHVDKALRESHLKKPERSYVFLNELLASGASSEYIANQVLSIIIAGRDTTAAALAACFYFLARDPEAVRRCRREVAELGTADPSFEDLSGMKYLGNVVRESLRLFPPVPTNSRKAIRDTLLPRGGGKDGKAPVLVPKGTQVRWSYYCMHRRTDIYGPDADEFHPERWEGLKTIWEYLPFHGGPRICLGQQFARTQMLYTLFRVLQNFSAIESRDPGPLEMRTSTTSAFAKGCLVSMTPA